MYCRRPGQDRLICELCKIDPREYYSENDLGPDKWLEMIEAQSDQQGGEDKYEPIHDAKHAG